MSDHTKTVEYRGPHPDGVTVAGVRGALKPGEPVDVPATLADRLLEQDDFTTPGDKPEADPKPPTTPKPAAGRKED